MKIGANASVMRLSEQDDALEYCYQQGWTDGLPVVPPTPERVQVVLDTVRRKPTEVLGAFMPVGAEITVEKVAINAVLAGCLPEYFPTVLTAVECMADQEGSMGGLLTTIHGDTPLIVINGPIIRSLGFNAGVNTFGPGWRANATVGRAIALLMRNVAAGEPGNFDMATQTHPGKFTYCIAEFEDASPWLPYHVDRGFSEKESAVTVVGAHGPRHVVDMASVSAHGVLTTLSDAIAVVGTYNAYRGGEVFLVLSPTHARIIAGDGWTKEDVKYFIFNKARRRLGELKGIGYYNIGGETYWPRWIDTSDDETLVPIVLKPEDVRILVAGGEVGGYSSIIFCFGMPATTRIVPT
jgi:hypothetical protein